MNRFHPLWMAVVVALLSSAGANAADPPMLLKWSQLVAKGSPPPKRPLFGLPPAEEATQQQYIPEAKWMSMKTRQPGNGAPSPVVPELDGKVVSINGYVVPLDLENTTIREFLLVPYTGACVHVPPPPANQIIYVKAEQGFAITGGFDAVTVTGTMHTKLASTGLADAGYSLDADSVMARTQ